MTPVTNWKTSSFCSDSACVEVASFGETISVRDGKKIDARALTFGRHKWKQFLDGVAAGEFREL